MVESGCGALIVFYSALIAVMGAARARPFGGSSPGSGPAEGRCPGRLHRAPSLAPHSAPCWRCSGRAPGWLLRELGPRLFVSAQEPPKLAAVQAGGESVRCLRSPDSKEPDLWIAAALITYPSH